MSGLGKLYLVGVPIGNVDDITLRALNILKSVDVIACEDTRKAKDLFSRLNLKVDKPFYAHGSHNEHNSAYGLIDILKNGESMAYISDGGMPSISDPGFLLMREVEAQGVEVQVIPGVSAVTMALVGSSLPCDRFTFLGFLGKKSGERQKVLKESVKLGHTLVCYESPRRILSLLEDVKSSLGDVQVCVARELTKIHEEFVKGIVSDVVETFSTREEGVLGECVVLISPPENAGQISEKDLEKRIKTLLSEGNSPKDARDILHAETEISKKELYGLILAVK